jgi:arginine/serine-rich splicing factor 7
MALFVGHVPPDTTETQLENLFSPYGSIVRLDLKNGFAFVEFKDPRDAEDVITNSDKMVINEKNLVIEWSKKYQNWRRRRWQLLFS